MNTPQVTSLKQLLSLLREGYTLNEPMHFGPRPRCEVTLPMNLEVFFETSALHWYILEEIVRRFEDKLFTLENEILHLRKVQLKAPECGAGWFIVHVSNASAMRWQVTPEILYEEAMRNVTLNKDNDDFEVDEDLADDSEAQIAAYRSAALTVIGEILKGFEGEED